MGKVERFEDLEIWQIANAIAVDIYICCVIKNRLNLIGE